MIASPQKRRNCLVAGLMLVLTSGLLWSGERFMQETRSMLGPDAAYAADVVQPPLVRKKLPVPAAAAREEPVPAAPTIPATEPPATAPEKTERVASSEPAPPVAAPMPDPSPVTAPPPAKVEPPKSELASASLRPYPFSILLSSCKEKENALAAASRYRQTGLTSYIVRTDLGNKGIWWRTLAGHYRTLAEAIQAKNKLKLSDAVVVKTPYANLIGQYGSEAEAVEAANRVAQKEVFPYMVKGPGSSFQLMAGAFPSQQAAEINRRELDAKGISARTVQR
jgi:cell division protein FtsN